MSPATMAFDSGLDFIGGREFWAALARALNFFCCIGMDEDWSHDPFGYVQRGLNIFALALCARIKRTWRQ